jgi:hypothetical protein
LEELDEEKEPPSPGVAAAAGTLLYAKSYGGNEEEEINVSSEESKSDKSDESEYILPEGLAYSDDDDVVLLEIDSDDEAMKGFPRDTSKNKTYNRDGPQPPNLERYPEDDRQEVLDAYKKKRKAFNDQMRKKRAKLAREGVEGGGVNPSDFKGWNVERLRTMDEVETHPLKVGHTFSSRDILYLRVAEEANHRGIVIRVNRSDDQQFVASGIEFYVRATFADKCGWVVTAAVCREGGDILKIPPQYRVTEVDAKNRRAVTTPLKSRMIVPIILNAVGANPGIPYPYLRELLSSYAKPYALTDSILQEARDLAKKQLFGIAEENVQYTKGVEKELRELGHHVTVLYANRKEIIQSVCAVVLREEVDRLKKLKQTMGHGEQVTFIQRWKKDNELFLTQQFGMSDASNQKTFVKGVLFAPSTSTHIAPKLQDVLQADGAHSQFGKYTLYQAYGTNANGNMSPFAFGLLFGNEDKDNWSIFWNFVKELHPCLDDMCKTFLTDQDKGCIRALESTFQLAGQFMCSFHRRQNILKNCGGGKGRIPYSALWVYNMLISCHNMDALEAMKVKFYDHMHPTDAYYLQKLGDDVQYPAARCAVNDKICMYGKSASSGVESMNNANQIARQKTAVDVLNAVILLLKLEAERFDFYQRQAWEREDILTDKGMRLMEECFDGVKPAEYQMNTVIVEGGHQVTVNKAVVNAKRYTVFIPSDGRHGSRFGKCTCGLPATDGVPCAHMVAVAKSSSIEGLSRIQIMPYWWTTAHWREQYLMDATCNANISMESVKGKHRPDQHLAYCPSWTAGRKKGRPKSNTREKGIADHIQDSGKKRKRAVRMFCRICHKYNHNTDDCFKNPSKKATETVDLDLGRGEEKEEENDITGQEGRV